MDQNTEKLNQGHQEMMAYIHEKYKDDNFTFGYMFGGYPGSEDHNIIVYSEKYPDVQITVTCHDGDDGLFYGDDYLAMKYADQTEQLIKKSFDECFGSNYYVGYSPYESWSSDALPWDATFEQFVSDPKSAIDFSAIVYCAETINRDAVISTMKKVFSDNGLCTSGVVWFESDKPDLSDITMENYYSDYVSKGTYNSCLSIRMEDNNSFAEVEWK